MYFLDTKLTLFSPNTLSTVHCPNETETATCEAGLKTQGPERPWTLGGGGGVYQKRGKRQVGALEWNTRGDPRPPLLRRSSQEDSKYCQGNTKWG